MLLGHIVSAEPEIMGCFRSFVKHPYSRHPAVEDQPPTSVQVAHYSTDPPPPFWVLSHLEDFSIASLMVFIPRSLRLHGSNWPAKPGSSPRLVRSGLSSLCSSIQTQEAWQIWPAALICLLHSVFPGDSKFNQDQLF